MTTTGVVVLLRFGPLSQGGLDLRLDPRLDVLRVRPLVRASASTYSSLAPDFIAAFARATASFDTFGPPRWLGSDPPRVSALPPEGFLSRRRADVPRSTATDRTRTAPVWCVGVSSSRHSSGRSSAPVNVEKRKRFGDRKTRTRRGGGEARRERTRRTPSTRTPTTHSPAGSDSAPPTPPPPPPSRSRRRPRTDPGATEGASRRWRPVQRRCDRRR